MEEDVASGRVVGMIEDLAVDDVFVGDVRAPVVATGVHIQLREGIEVLRGIVSTRAGVAGEVVQAGAVAKAGRIAIAKRIVRAGVDDRAVLHEDADVIATQVGVLNLDLGGTADGLVLTVSAVMPVLVLLVTVAF